jgi:GNAT superfamily N-acetyltransferase
VSDAAAQPVTIRTAVAADTPLILSLIRELAEYEHLLDEVIATEETLRASLFGDRPGAEVVIAEQDGTVAGYALFFHNFSTFHGRRGLYLEDLFVRPAHRGAGIGRLLLSHLAALAVQRDCARFEWAVLDWNAPSIEFYQHLGAKPMSDWTVFRMEGEALRRLAEREQP